MKIFLGADHGGYELKNTISEHLVHRGFTVEDCGATTLDPKDDYPQYAYDVAAKILGEEDGQALGILVCRSGEGMAMAANRVHGVRAAVVWDQDLARETRRDNHANVLSLPADFVDPEAAIAIVESFIAEKPSQDERHTRRVKQVEELYG
ncbi:MAG TPA: RpiB/LacA/LacB family sugar-phosphate isomerase [Candidatus Saccharimonadales bacterium]|nr:RpiB/LacA/LacB family sugar-phosphate isomerase [Candidatus Saccharimonadales bacterium]